MSLGFFDALALHEITVAPDAMALAAEELRGDVRKQRNRAAARASRQRRKDKIETLEQQVVALERLVLVLTRENARMRSSLAHDGAAPDVEKRGDVVL